jgi:hypothetical protein
MMYQLRKHKDRRNAIKVETYPATPYESFRVECDGNGCWIFASEGSEESFVYFFYLDDLVAEIEVDTFSNAVMIKKESKTIYIELESEIAADELLKLINDEFERCGRPFVCAM